MLQHCCNLYKGTCGRPSAATARRFSKPLRARLASARPPPKPSTQRTLCEYSRAPCVITQASCVSTPEYPCGHPEYAVHSIPCPAGTAAGMVATDAEITCNTYKRRAPIDSVYHTRPSVPLASEGCYAAACGRRWSSAERSRLNPLTPGADLPGSLPPFKHVPARPSYRADVAGQAQSWRRCWREVCCMSRRTCRCCMLSCRSARCCRCSSATTALRHGYVPKIGQ